VNDDLRALLQELDPSARDDLRRVLIRDQTGNDWANIIDMLTMHPEERRKVVRVLGEMEAAGQR
jgi:hypothetical protein